MTVVQSTQNGRKRKAETTSRTKRTTAQYTEVEEVAAVASNSPRTSKRATKKVKYEQETDNEMVDQQSDNGEGRPKQALKRTKKVAAQGPVTDAKLNDDSTVEDNKISKKNVKSTEKKAEDVNEEKPKKVTKSKAKPAKILPPIAERTKDIKLRVGAHVSIAGG